MRFAGPWGRNLVDSPPFFSLDQVSPFSPSLVLSLLFIPIPTHPAMKKNTFLIVFTLCDSSENAHNNFNGIGATYPFYPLHSVSIFGWTGADETDLHANTAHTISV